MSPTGGPTPVKPVEITVATDTNSEQEINHTRQLGMSQQEQQVENKRQQETEVRESREKRKQKKYRQRLLIEFNEEGEIGLQENLPWGDLAEVTPQEDHVRIYFQNVKGKLCTEKGVGENEIATEASHINVSIMGMAETNTNWDTTNARQICRKNWSKTFTGLAMEATCSSRGQTPGKIYHPGGAALLVTGTWTGRISMKGSDPKGLGRWSYMTLQGKRGTSITIISAYQVNKDSICRNHSNTAYFQQWNILHTAGEQNPDPRTHFVKDIKEQ